MSAFLDALHSGRVLLMDGAMGTELQRAGMPEGACYELWNLTHPDKVRAIHQAYVEAGAEILLTNTFQAHPAALAKHECLQRLPEMQTAAVQLASLAAGPERFVLADIGPVERLELLALPDFLKAYRSVDGILLETSTDFELIKEVMACQAASPESEQVPLLVSFSFLRDASGELRTYQRLSPETVAIQVAALQACALGVNCGRDLSIDDVIEVIRRYRSTTDLPLFARPNAGTPKRANAKWEYPYSPRSMAQRLPELLEAGVAMVGGCCGTTPEHIAAFSPIVAAWNARKRHDSPFS
jgi:5-methyltetrahydrofolate--homocysteine methyltransferase